MSQSHYQHGLELFNEGHFYDAHEVLEDVWRETAGPPKNFLQALIQIAVALHHHGAGNTTGATSLLAKAQTRLAVCPDPCEGICVAALRENVHRWQLALASGSPLPPFPQAQPASPAKL